LEETRTRCHDRLRANSGCSGNSRCFGRHASSRHPASRGKGRARTCCDHIAGLLGVALAERLSEREFVILGDEAGEVTPAGAEFLSNFGVDLSSARAKRRIFCRPCVDWTERRSHIGGAVGAALAKRCSELKWIEPVRDSRALTITPAGRRGLLEIFDFRSRAGWRQSGWTYGSLLRASSA
jgi:hypothetical protein